MNLLRFRVIIDIEEDVFRDILIGRTASLEDFHRGILAAFDFGEGEMASFFQSDEDWGRGREVPLMTWAWMTWATPTLPCARPPSRKLPPKRTTAWSTCTTSFACGAVEVIGIEEGDTPEFPLLAQEFGEAPDQFSKEVDLGMELDEPEEEDKGPLKTGDPELDAYLAGEEDEEDSGPSFTSLDDLDDAAY